MADTIECNEASNASNVNNQQFRLHKINEIKDYFIAEIKERELMSKRLSKYIACFDYFDKSLIAAFPLHHLNSYWNTCRSSKFKS